jgi:class 3 adenylate cyclase
MDLEKPSDMTQQLWLTRPTLVCQGTLAVGLSSTHRDGRRDDGAEALIGKVKKGPLTPSLPVPATSLGCIAALPPDGKHWRKSRRQLAQRSQGLGLLFRCPFSRDARKIQESACVRQLLAVVYFDMVGYSRMIYQDDVGVVERMRVLRFELIDPIVERHHGFLVHTAGDSLLVVFVSAIEAAQCAVEVQRRFPHYDHDEELGCQHRIRFRIGIDVGETIVHGADLHGDAVNTAARLQAICPPGGVCISREAYEYVRSRLDVQFDPLGTFRLKNIARLIEALVFRPEARKSARQDPSAEPPRQSTQDSVIFNQEGTRVYEMA